MKLTTLLRCCCPALLLAAVTASARAQTDDFNDGNDAGWTKYEPLKGYGVASSIAVSGGAYVLTCDPSPNPTQLGQSRVGALRQGTVYSTFCVTVDIANWNPAEDTSMGILARLQSNPPPGLGTTNGYAFTYQGKDGDVQISRVDGEVPTSLSGSPDVSLTAGESYRMVFFGIGSHLEGRIYATGDLVNPLITATGNDAGYSQGTCGLVIFADENTRASATFDNYNATAGTPPPVAVSIAEGITTVSWNSASSLCHSLQASNDLLTWNPLFGFTAAGGNTVFSETWDFRVSSRFFRLRMGPAGIGVAR